MSKIWLLLAVLLPGGTLFVLAGALVRRWMMRRRTRMRRLELIYLRTLVAMCGGRWNLYRFPWMGSPGSRSALAGAIAGLCRATYGCDRTLLRSVMRSCDIERMLFRRLRRPFGRARTLALLSALPLESSAMRKLEPYARSRNRQVRFYALLARLSAAPARAMELLRAYADEWTDFECRELLALLRRGVLPLPYEPLLQAPEANLRRLGLCIVRHFGVEAASERLLALSSDDRMRRETLEALCDFHRPLSGAAGEAWRALSGEERRALLRRAAAEGYALRGVEELLCGDERLYFERLAASYKSSALWA